MTDHDVAEPSSAPAPAESTADPRPSLEEWREVEETARLLDETRERDSVALRGEWGEGYDARLSAARRLAQDVATPELVAAIDRAGLGDDPHFLRAVARLAERVYGSDGAGPADAGGKQKRLDELHALQHHADPGRRAQYRSRAVQAELERLYTAIYGDGPVIGQARSL